MKIRLFEIFILFFNTFSLAQTIDPYKFYPSAVGNKWRWISYSNSSTYDSEITKDSLAEDGRRFLFFNASLSPRFIVDTSRQVWQIIDNKPVLWYKLDTQPGDSFTTSIGGNNYEVHVNSATASAFGQTVPAKVFSWSYGDMYPNYAVHWLVYGVGLYSTYSYIYNLDDIVTGYIIDGVKYGTLTNVEKLLDVNPSEYSLSQNFPNPFNSTTLIRFSISKDTYVTLDLFDTLGRKVRTILRENKSSGVYQVSFSGNDLPSGAYIIRMQAGSFLKTCKIILTK